MRYEVIREIYNNCSGNQMRDVFVSTEELDDPQSYVKDKIVGDIEVFECNKCANGDIIIDITVNGLKQRYSFSQD